MRDLSLHLTDIIENSIAADATKISVTISTDKACSMLEISVCDDGCGMDAEMLSNVTDPFVTTRTTRRIGLGLPLLAASAQMAGGNLEVSSEPGNGTDVKATFAISHIDRLPLGNVGEMVVAAIISSPGTDFELFLESENNSFTFSLRTVRESISDVAVTRYEILDWIREYVNEGVTQTFGGVLHEIVS